MKAEDETSFLCIDKTASKTVVFVAILKFVIFAARRKSGRHSRLSYGAVEVGRVEVGRDVFSETPVRFPMGIELEPTPIVTIPFCDETLSATPLTGFLLLSVPVTTLPRKLAPDEICWLPAKLLNVEFNSTFDCNDCICES